MNLPTIEVPRQKAREAFLEYREAVRDKRHPSHVQEDEALMRTYKALMKGERIIRLTEALRAGGTHLLTVPSWNEQQIDVEVPAIAVARADTTRVWTTGITREGHVRMTTQHPRQLAHNNRRDVFSRSSVFPEADRTVAFRATPVAIVPTIPPKLRPKRTQLHNFHVLFEAEWGIDPEPPVDPALIRHLGGDLYAVVAVWDLTDVERAVLAMTR